MIANIGGIFLYSEHPNELVEWYRKNLEVKYKYTEEYDAYYASFPYLDKHLKKETYTIFSIMPLGNRPVPKERPFTINLRVHDIERVVNHLVKHGANVKGIEVYDEGKFAWTYDLDGNHIELWEDTNI
jgi:D-3-phosphoglycerate dehydrogenase / 2-oxoglutarate reductase